MSTRARLAAAVLLTAAFVVTGCSGDSDGKASGGPGETAAGAAPAPADGSQTDQGRQATKPGQPQPQQSQGQSDQPSLARAVIRSGYLTVEAGDVRKARDQVNGIATTYGGQITTEDTGTDDEGATDRANLVLKVPTTRYDQAMAALQDSRLGKVKQVRQESSDVTEQVVDVNSRIATQRAGLARMRALLSRANTIGEVISVETELTRREADLESLLGRQKALAEQTDLATISVTVVRPGEAPPPPKEDHSGFLGGLAAGWGTLRAGLTALATAAGAVLPFAAAVALIAVPLWLLYRRQRRTAAPAPMPSTPPDQP